MENYIIKNKFEEFYDAKNQNDMGSNGIIQLKNLLYYLIKINTININNKNNNININNNKL